MYKAYHIIINTCINSAKFPTSVLFPTLFPSSGTSIQKNSSPFSPVAPLSLFSHHLHPNNPHTQPSNPTTLTTPPPFQLSPQTLKLLSTHYSLRPNHRIPALQPLLHFCCPRIQEIAEVDVVEVTVMVLLA